MHRVRAGSVGRRGFTLVEVLVAMTVLAIGSVTVFGALRMAHEGAERVRDEAAARGIAERRLSCLLAKPAERLAPASGQDGKFAWQESMKRSVIPEIAVLTVTVKWQSRGRDRETRLSSLRELS